MDIGTMFKEKNITNNFNNRNLCQSVLIRENLCYDNAGNRFIKQTVDISTNKENTTLYLRHGQIAVAMDIEITGDSTTDKGKINRYVLSGDLLAGRVTTTVKLDDSKETAKYYYHLDHLNSTKCVTKEAGTLVVMYEYRAFGEQLKKLGEGEAKYTYGGKELDDETNLYYFNARFYDATIGRFINVDPIQDGTNWYVYCSNNPLSFVDPTGLKNHVIISTFQGGGNENVGDTFRDAANTRANEIRNSDNFNPKNDTVTVYDINSKKEFADILEKGDIDNLENFGHGGQKHLTIVSGEGPGKREQLYASDLKDLNKNAFNDNATIKLHQCKTASEKGLFKIFGEKNIAQNFAKYFKGTNVTGFKGGGIALPSPNAEIDTNFIHKKGDDVWYKSWNGERTYNYENKK